MEICMPGLDRQLRFCRGNTHYCRGVGTDAIRATDRQTDGYKRLEHFLIFSCSSRNQETFTLGGQYS